MTGEIGAMATDALAAACDGRGFQRAIAGCVMASGTTIDRMHLTGTNEGRGGGSVATCAIISSRGNCHILFHLATMVVVMAVKV